jgi:hypothetical protein
VVDGLFTVAQLADRGIVPMNDEQIRAATVGRTVRSVNLVTGFTATIHYDADGEREELTYAEVSARVHQTATMLYDDLGVRRGNRVPAGGAWARRRAG